MARRLSVVAVVIAMSVLLVLSGASAARRLENGGELAVAVATGRPRRLLTQMAALVREETEEGGGSGVSASKRLSPGGPDPEHH